MTLDPPSQFAVARYLGGYGEAVALNPPQNKYDFVVIVPMFDEQPESLARLLQNNTHLNILVIAVVNAPAGASNIQRMRTKALLQTAPAACPVDCWVIDAVSQPLPAKQGVGLARKIGNDAACRLWLTGQISSDWLYQGDADSVLPRNYFSTQLPDRGAVVFAYQHNSLDPLLQKAAELYERHMYHYVRGLQLAGSRYAYPTLGSAMTVHVRDYAGVRGFPKRSAAEDFYLLNKIAKVSQVRWKTEVTVSIQARLSHRVPFGTGPALQKIISGFEQDASGAFYKTYHPGSFTLLAAALRHLEAVAAGEVLADDHASRLLRELGIDQLIPKLQVKYRTPEQRALILTQWFDAGKTLRFIHLARRYYADISMQTLDAYTSQAADL